MKHALLTTVHCHVNHVKHSFVELALILKSVFVFVNIFFFFYSLKQIVRPCRRNGQCQMNIATRKMCAACRLAKCLSVGMSRDLIRKEISPSLVKKASKCQKLMVDVISEYYNLYLNIFSVHPKYQHQICCSRIDLHYRRHNGHYFQMFYMHSNDLL